MKKKKYVSSPGGFNSLTLTTMMIKNKFDKMKRNCETFISFAQVILYDLFGETIS